MIAINKCVLIFFVASSFGFTEKLLDYIKTGDVNQKFLRTHEYTLAQLNTPINGITPLVAAIKERKIQAVRTLVDAGADIRAPVQNTLPIEYAVDHASVPIVKYLLSHGATLSPTACQNAMYHTAMAKFFMHIFKKYRLGSIYDGNNCFFMTRAQVDLCLNNMLLNVQTESQLIELLNLGAHANYTDQHKKNSLDYAQQHEKRKFAKILRTQGTGPDNIDQQLFSAIKNNTLTGEFLKKYFTGINRRNINRVFTDYGAVDALAYAVNECNEQAVQLLLKYGAHNKRNALIIALKKCPKSMLQLLVQHKILLGTIPHPLELIIQYNPDAPAIIDWLASRIMRIERHKTLLFACVQGNEKIAQILVHHGADVNFHDHAQRSPLFNALVSRNTELAQWLLANGAKNKFTKAQNNFVQAYLPKFNITVDAQ